MTDRLQPTRRTHSAHTAARRQLRFVLGAYPGSALRDLRHVAGLTTRELGDACHVTHQAIERSEACPLVSEALFERRRQAIRGLHESRLAQLP